MHFIVTCGNFLCCRGWNQSHTTGHQAVWLYPRGHVTHSLVVGLLRGCERVKWGCRTQHANWWQCLKREAPVHVCPARGYKRWATAHFSAKLMCLILPQITVSFFVRDFFFAIFSSSSYLQKLSRTEFNGDALCMTKVA